jgi:ethanolamine-phosphate cytidylyltransferase
LLTTFGIDVVVRGSVHEVSTRQAAREAERYGVPRDKGMLRVLSSPSNMTSAALIKRVVENLAQIEERQAKKNASEAKYYSGTKQYVQEM